METKICTKCGIEKENINFRIMKDKRLCSWCRECEREYNKEYSKKYRIKNQQELQEKAKKYWENHREQQRLYCRKSKKKNMKQQLEYQKNRRYTDKTYKLKQQTRHLINMSFTRKSYNKNTKTHKILGCNYDMFINHLLKTYKENYGEDYNLKEKINIDHIIPLSTAQTEEEVIKLCHYTNLQLLKEKDNLEKGDSLNWKLKK